MKKQIQTAITLCLISLLTQTFTNVLADEKSTIVIGRKPHRFVIPCNNEKESIIVFDDDYSNVEIILEENGLVIEYMIKETVLHGECITITCPDNNSEYTLTIKANASIIYKEVIKKK